MKIGDIITFKFNGEIMQGTIILTGKNMVRVECKGMILVVSIDKIIE
jgi:hypothetical protein